MQNFGKYPKGHEVESKGSQGLAPVNRTMQTLRVDRTANSELRPTMEAYNALESAFDWFNDHLFKSVLDVHLPHVMITMPKNRVYQGYFQRRVWAGKEGNRRASEIALNPFFFDDEYAVCGTLVHEMIHHLQAEWPEEFKRPRTPGYHNRAFAQVSIALGLMPVAADGRATGVAVTQRIIPGGLFEKICRAFLDHGNSVSWSVPLLRDTRDTNSDGTSDGTDGSVTANDVRERKRRSKTKYRCASCRLNAWAKPEAALICGKCRIAMQPDRSTR